MGALVGVPDLFSTLIAKAARIAAGWAEPHEKLMVICRMLRNQMPHYDWVGFYLVDPDNPRELVLGPFAGDPTEHVRIPFGRGVCGRAAERGETIAVPDVSLEDNYLSCSPRVKAEIVVPVFREGRIVGELDVDSHLPDPFTPDDRRLLEEIARISSPLI